MIPILYDSDESAFVSNGLCRLRDVISCVVTEERNGIYECDFEYPVNGANYDLIQCGRIIAVTHDETGDVQPFEIVSCTRPIDKIVAFHAVHISYRQSKMTVSGTNVNSLADAFTLLRTATPSNPFSYWTDKTSTGAFTAANGVPHSVRQMLGGMEGSILDCYGGEYEWDKWQVKLWASRGVVRDFAIRYGVNLVGYEEEINYSDTYTSCIPYWVGDDGNGGQTIVKGNKVNTDVPSYNGYDACIPLDLTEKFEEQPTTQQLEDEAYRIMANGSVYVPAQTINVEFVRLQDSPEYEQYAALMECRLCDSINVIFPDYNVSRSFKIVRTVYDVLEERFTEMELGQLSTTLSEALGISANASAGGSGGGGGGGADPSTTLPIMDGVAAIGVEAKYARGDHVHPSDTSRVPTTREINGYPLSTDVTLTASDVGAQEPLVSGTNIKTVNGSSLLGSGNLDISAGVYTGTSSTAENNSQKVVTGSPTFIQETGNLIAVTFTNANTEDRVDLEIDSTGIHPVYVNGVVTSSANPLHWDAGQTVLFQCRLNGPQYVYDFISKTNNGKLITSPNIPYCTCSTAAGTAAKTTTIVSGTFTEDDLVTGAQVLVKFTNANSVASPTLAIGSTTAKSIRRYGTTAPSTSAASSWNAGAVVMFIYDGTYWVMENWLNTTYSSMTEAEITAGTGTTARLITPARLKTAIQTWIQTMTGSTSSSNGSGGLVPIPYAGSEDKMLFGDGTWDALAYSTMTESNKITLLIERGNGITLYNFTIPLVSSSYAGLMSPSNLAKLNNIYGITGSVYETTRSDVDPATLFGGSWALIGQLITDDDVELMDSDGEKIYAELENSVVPTYKWVRYQSM